METTSPSKTSSDNLQSSIFNLQSSVHWAPAKVNVRLKITGRRADGYHELVSIMVPINLCDRIELQTTSFSGITISCEGFSAPADGENLACLAARAFFARTGMDQGLSMKLTKNIPVAAGLGGGSSDAACVLMALNQTLARPLNQEALAELALTLGADVPFFLRQRPCIARGIGEILEPIEKWPELWYVIIMPPIKVSTAWVYDHLNGTPSMGTRELELTNEEYQFTIKVLKKKPVVMGRVMNNDLERVTAARYPAIDHAKRYLMEAGADGALMSGSGPSVFGVFESREKALRSKIFLASLGLGDVFLAQGLP